MQKRQNALNQWLNQLFYPSQFTLTSLVADASFRCYHRLFIENKTFVVMDAPPEKESLNSFLKVGQTLSALGVHTPKVYEVEPQLGFILLEDLGDNLLLNTLAPNTQDGLYKAAMTTILQIQQCQKLSDFPVFNRAFMLQEMFLFRDWFLHQYLALTLDAEEEKLLLTTFNWIVDQVARQPQVLIHRDYHSRNLLVIKAHTPFHLGVIDFQDAMQGPWTYDLVSLLKDCYIQWPHDQIQQWLSYFYHALPNNFNQPLPYFIHDFEVCGLQRHLKVLGIFCRLHLRDQKSAYLKDLPLVLKYVLACLEQLHEIRPFYQWMQQKIQPEFMEKKACIPL